MFVLKGNICYCETPENFTIKEDGYLVCIDGECEGVYETLPENFSHLPIYDRGQAIIIPGLSDLHTHAPQYAFRGLGMDLELLDWLNTNTFPEEALYNDLSYAEKAYSHFVETLKKGATTRACIFATIHEDSTIKLMEMLEETGLCTYVGKVNMDRNSPDYLIEESPQASEESTIRWLERTKGFKRTRPIITPRFIPSCSDDLMARLRKLCLKYNTPLQSHLSENPGEIDWVRELSPASKFYGDAYYIQGLFGGDIKTVMAHCVYSGEEEMELMKKQGVFIAHCPESNANLSSGVAPVREFLNKGIRTGLGSDVAGGAELSIFRAMAMAIQCSKLRWRLKDESLSPLKASEAFYLATKGGGEFFGKVGSFEKGYEFDAVVIDDSSIPTTKELTIEQRLERLIYLEKPGIVKEKYIKGKKVGLSH